MSTVVTLGPVGFKPTGAYDNTREYKKLDVVIYQGSSYVAKSDSIGQLPTNTTYWNCIAEKGSKGDPGEVTEEQLDEAMARANMVYNALPKVSDEGDSLTLDGTANCPMKMELKGNTEQTTYTGKNLINFPYYETTKTVNGITFTVKNDGTIHVQGTASARAEFLLRNRDINLSITEGETYTLATSGLGTIDNDLWLAIYGQTGNFLDKWALSQITTYTSAVAQSKDIKPLLRISVANGATINTDVKVWLYKGSYDETTTYEPYVGGTPSPNPDYPQDVRVVTSNNSVKVIGKNLFDKDSIVETTYYINPTNGNHTERTGSILYKMEVLPNTSYTRNNIKNSSNVTFFSSITYWDKNDNYISGSWNATQTITTPNNENVKYMIWSTSADITQYSDTQTYLDNFMIEKGNQSSTYTPYVSQTYPINLGTMELCKIGTYQDYIYKSNGKWYKHSEICKVVLDGSESWVLGQTLTNTMHYNISDFTTVATNIKIPTSETTGNIISNYFQEKGNLYNVDEIGIDLHANKNLIVGVYSSTAPTLTDFKDWLSTNNVSIYYVLATPTNTEITDTTLISQLNNIKNAVSYDTQTNIVQENYSEPFIINAECVRSLKDIFELI